MAYINVLEWTPDKVTDWLKGLDDSMYSYVYSFTNNQVGGRQLLNIRPYELQQLGMHSIGHQEILLEAVENLRNFHYNLDKENLQFMALHVATAARSLHRQLAIHCDSSKVETQILNDITRTIGTIKPLIGWLDRAPFRGQKQFAEICCNMLRLGLEMATIAQRDRFVEGPAEQIRVSAKKLERLANYIIQDITDPMLLQPASLNLVTLKKRESELGFNIEPSYHGNHRVTDINHNSPAHNSGKIEDGDEIVQINYQTVVGWQYKTVLLQLRESLPDVLLTLKKRPKHTKIYGQIYMQPYRLPSKKRVIATRWGENLPSPRAGFLTVPLKAEEKANAAAASSDTDSICSDILTPTDTKATEKENRLYYPKPRAMLQRRYTICSGEFLDFKLVGISIWPERKTGVIRDPSSPSLRDKSVSFGFGLEITPRPTTCIGIAIDKFSNTSSMKGLFSEKKSLEQVPEHTIEHNEPSDVEEKSKPGISKVVRFDANMKYEDYPVNEKFTCNVENTILETFEPIPFVDEEEGDALNTFPECANKSDAIFDAIEKTSKCSKITPIEAVNYPTIVRRGRLDKSHSTPAYDNSGEESDTPPAIEPRKEFLLLTPPVPPPRPKKQQDLAVPPPPPKPASLISKVAPIPFSKMSTHSAETVISTDRNATVVKQACSLNPNDSLCETSELHTPTKTRTLTLKKKHSLVLKRRNINLKLLGTGDIQGHLYRRTKDRRGVTFWARVYFVMLDTILYGFRSKEAQKACCVIFLPGFTVSLAKEVHSRPFAFKVYHSTKTFYFAAESQDALNQWVEFIRQATLETHYSAKLFHELDAVECDVNTKDLFSETDSSGEETESVVAKNLCTPSPQNTKTIAFMSSCTTKSSNSATASVKSDRRYLGSLRKLTKGSLPFKSCAHNDKKISSDIPVPTDQYRSYRKVPGGSFGIQIGTNSGYHSYNTNAHQNVLKTSESTLDNTIDQRKPSLASSRSSLASNAESTLTCSGPPSSPTPVAVSPSVTSSVTYTQNSNHGHTFDSPKSKNIKKIPYNFIHASNPNLVEFDFQTSKTLDYSLPKINPSNSWEAHHNIQGFVTLKDLMLQKQKEDAQEMYNNCVILGVEKKEQKRKAQRRIENKHQATAISQPPVIGVGGKLSKTQSRSLPKTPDYEISFKPDDEDIKRTRTKEGLKLRDFGYEFISGDEPLEICGGMASRQNSNVSMNCTEDHHEHNMTSTAKARYILKSQQFIHSSNKNKKFMEADVISGGERRMGSFKKKGKFEAVKTSSERIFQFNRQASGSSGMTMTLPLNKKPNHIFENMNSTGAGIKKSHTYNNDLKEKACTKYEAHRKNSAPMPIFSKLSFTSAPSSINGNNNNKISKKLLGSPLLHRTIFGSQHQPTSTPVANCITTGREYDREIFSQVIFPQISNPSHVKNEPKFRKFTTSNATITAPDILAPPPPTITATQSAVRPPMDRDNIANKSMNLESNVVATPDYPDLECPPVFEPEIYSLTDPNVSLTLLLRRRNSGNGSGNDENQPM